MEGKASGTAEVARQGKLLYEQVVRPQLSPKDEGKVVVIDVASGHFVIDEDHLAAAKEARARHPDGRLFAVRVGSPALVRIGGSFRARTAR
jgi:hypothetical protein